MAVAWIGDRETPVGHAVEYAAGLLRSSRCPVFSFDTDIHGTRAAITLAERVGAACDLIDGQAIARETALFTDRGGMLIAPGETRRRADVVIVVGEVPAAHDGLIVELTETIPDLAASKPREFFVIDDGKEQAPRNVSKARAMRLTCGDGGPNATLAALRAQLAGRKVTAPVSNFDAFAKALADARFPVFLFSGDSADTVGLEMLQGLIADLNRKSRASALHLTASENGWGGTLASTWMTGFPLRTGFGRGFPEFDPWRFDVARMIADGEADFHLWISGQPGRLPTQGQELPLVALARTGQAIAGAACTLAIGEPGVDHDAVIYASRTGTLTSVAARSASELSSAASIIRSIGEHLAVEASPC